MDAQKRIKQLMEERGWTDYRLAKEANLSHSTITNVFKRNNAPTLPTLEVICRAFGITLAQFFAEGSWSKPFICGTLNRLTKKNFLTICAWLVCGKGMMLLPTASWQKCV